MRFLRAMPSQVLSISKDGNATFKVTSFLFLPFVLFYSPCLRRFRLCLLYPLPRGSWRNQQLGQLKQRDSALAQGGKTPSRQTAGASLTPTPACGDTRIQIYLPRHVLLGACVLEEISPLQRGSQPQERAFRLPCVHSPLLSCGWVSLAGRSHRRPQQGARHKVQLVRGSSANTVQSWDPEEEASWLHQHSQAKQQGSSAGCRITEPSRLRDAAARSL